MKKILLHPIITSCLLILICIFIYEILTDFFEILDPLLFPGLSKVIPAFIKSFPRLLESFVSSMSLLIPAYLVGAILGVTFGVIIASNNYLVKIFKPIIFSLSPIPPSMLVPYFIAILPTFYLSSAAVIFVGCFWPFLSGTINGIILIDQKYLNNTKVLEITGFKKLFYITLPAAAPMILSGAGTALTFSFILLTVAEMFATDSGMGHFIQYYADFSDYARVLAGLLFTTIIFVSIMFIYELIKSKVLFWMLDDQ